MKLLRLSSGEPLTLGLIAVSILGGIALAIACSYRPIALWWVMVGCSAVNVVRFGARLSQQSSADRPHAPARPRVIALVAWALTRSIDAFARARSGTSKASLDRQHARFLVWFAEHNLLWTTIGFGVSLLLWHRFGPTAPALVVMAALMSCGLFAALGAAAGASSPALGLCWREPCRRPDFQSIRRIVHDIGCIVVLANRRDYAARCDWAKGGRFHELFLTVDDLARVGIEPGLEAVLAADDVAARRALARKERLDRAVALTPVFAAGLLAALLVIPPLAGSEPLPSLWTIVSRTANSQPRASARGDDNARDLPSGSTTSPDRRQAQEKVSDRSSAPPSPSSDAARDRPANGEPAASASKSGQERPDLSGQGGEESITGDAIASARGNGAGAAGKESATQGGEGRGAGGGAPGSGDASSSDEGQSGRSGGRGGGPRGYGTGGIAPQRAESPTALPDAAVNPGKAIEVVLPAFSQARDGSPDDNPTGTKRKAQPSEQARAARPRHDAAGATNETATRQPVQRWPNWVFQLLHK